MLPAFSITVENGYSYQTSMAAHVTLEMAKEYFLGSRIDVGTYPVEDMQQVIRVEAI